MLTSSDLTTVTGIELEDSSAIAADLVVDASGRAGRSAKWLAALGYEEPPVSAVTIDMAYASRVYRMRQEGDSEVAFVMAPPPGPAKD